MRWEPVIGLEIHAELKTRTKMFCDSLNDPNESRPNTNVCPICMAHPGSLPTINRQAVEKVIQVGLALSGSITPFTFFERKNYFYPDLPKGYQISQYARPLVENASLDISRPDGAVERIRVRRIHLEEDTGRSIHDSKTKTTLVDFNRAGIPLMELVTEPDLHNPTDARLAAESLQRIFQYVGASDANMDKGEMRIEANVSVRPAGSSELGTKVELKNINSFRFVDDAIRTEIARQTTLLERGEKVIQETRGWDAAAGTTVSQRLKEESQDYRYFPEPDLPPLEIGPETIETLRQSLPELPAVKLERFRNEYGIDAKIAATLVRDRRFAAFFEATASELHNQSLQLAANYLTTDIVKLLAAKEIAITEAPLTPENFAELITYIASNRISSRSAKETLAAMISSSIDPSVYIDEHGLWQESADTGLNEAAAHVIAANKKAADDFRKGKKEALQFLTGQVMKEARGADPKKVRALLEEQLRD
ncbi:MAG: Asp-tRNA(Asn)/Glu-tRNA(Gln) amidotransferase subunit GatB [Candidatus Sungbacteria bacterium]|uniref:Aspartyl/glutamyl-tRNA(Asn/Gln) amidotransferase subunit B n=1 Tax=Candidatus Sungiibacteriota bacterium TaxID=2750080 RepID=A0A932YVW6_9BACT|nr:Asp-tRNA(Asn)/Glu-tRNA(Gln) amidotransferase subunit GatB [Candidatus Sungbacteria bacterium]